MQDLKDVTRDVHYENYRARHIQQQLVHSQKERKSVITASIASSSLIAIIIIIIIIVVVVIRVTWLPDFTWLPVCDDERQFHGIR